MDESSRARGSKRRDQQTIPRPFGIWTIFWKAHVSEILRRGEDRQGYFRRGEAGWKFRKNRGDPDLEVDRNALKDFITDRNWKRLPELAQWKDIYR